jgi:hypothetical protein
MIKFKKSVILTVISFHFRPGMPNTPLPDHNIHREIMQDTLSAIVAETSLH